MFEYIYGKEDCRCQFFKVPLMLFTNEVLAGLSNEAKLLYGLLLDRTGLSIMNDWTDEDGRVYVNYTNAEVCHMLKIGAQKAVKIFRELAAIGLIERIRIGLGRPDRIFVKHICTAEQPEEQPCEPVPEIEESIDFPEPEMQNYENQHSEISDFSIPECSESAFPLNNNQTDRVRKNQSYPSHPAAEMQREKSINLTTVEMYREQIKANIEYDWFVESYADHDKIGGSQEELDELVEIMTECACATKSVWIHGQEMPAEVVKSRMLKIGSEHIQYVFDCLARTTTKIANIKAYLLTVLYNAPTTISNYYSTLVRHHMHCIA